MFALAPFALLGNKKFQVRTGLIGLLIGLNTIVISFLFGAYNMPQGMFLIGYSALAATSLNFLVDLLVFLNDKIHNNNIELTKDERFRKDKILKKYIIKSIAVFALILLIPFLIYLCLHLLNVFVLKFSNVVFLSFYYFVLLTLGSYIAVNLKNILVSSKSILKMYDEILNELPNYIVFLYYKACNFAIINNPKGCIELLQKIIELDNHYIVYIKEDNTFNFNDIRHLNEFQKLLKTY